MARERRSMQVRVDAATDRPGQQRLVVGMKIPAMDYSIRCRMVA
jgi:hypothetical protein